MIRAARLYYFTMPDISSLLTCQPMKLITSTILAAVVLSVSPQSWGSEQASTLPKVVESSSISIIPQPQSLTELKQAPYVLTKDTTVLYRNPELKRSAELLAETLNSSTGYNIQIGLSDTSTDNAISLKLDPKLNELGKEGYQLKSNKLGVTISAFTPTGVFYGTHTLRQLFPSEIFYKDVIAHSSWSAPAVEISDQPRFPWRSYMLDVARNFHGPQTVKMLIDQMAIHKLNRFHWHLTDDQGWRIEIKKYPKLTSIGGTRTDTQVGGWRSPKFTGKPHSGFYTQEEIKEIVQYAADRHIMIIPEIGMPGHASAIIAAYPEFRCMEQTPPTVATTFGKKPYVLDVSNEKLYPFISDIIDEVIELFPGNVIHIGGDEVQTAHWQKSAAIKALMEREKITNYSDVQVYFTNRIVDMIQSKNRRVMGWNEITGDKVHGGTKETAKRTLSKTAIVQFWKGDVKLLTKAITSGYDCVNSTHSQTYLDYTYPYVSVEKAYKFDPIPRGLAPEHESKVVGFGCQMWGEFIHYKERLEYRTFPRFCAYSEVGWTELDNKDFERFKNTLEDVHYRRLAYHGIRYAKNVFMHEPHTNSDFEDYIKIGEWNEKIITSGYLFNLDVNHVIKSNGKYEVAFVFKPSERSKHAVCPLYAELLEDGKVIAIDNHPGYASKTPYNNVYRFELNNFKEDSKYTVRSEYCMSKGWKTEGEIKMIKK